MTYTSILEKILCVFSIVSSSWLYIMFSLIAIILFALLVLKKISKKACFVIITLLVKVLLGYTVYIHYDVISNLVNNIVDNIFLNIYFPSAYVYLFVLLFVNVVAVGNLLKKTGDKVYKTINGICLVIINFVLVLILEVIAKSDVDIFAKESLFTNTNLVMLLEFSINIFVVWLISLMAVYFINNITERILITNSNKTIRNKVIPEGTLSINAPALVDEYSDDNRILEKPVTAIISDVNNKKFIPNFTVEVNEYRDFVAGNLDVAEQSKVIDVDNKFIPNVELGNVVNTNCDTDTFDLSAFIPKKQIVKPLSVDVKDSNELEENVHFIDNELSASKVEVKEAVSSVEDIKNTYTLNDYRIFNKMLKDIREHNQGNSVTIDKNLEYRLILKYSAENYNMFKTMLKIYSN